jgi:predicted component of type VI protein secretion system
MLPLVVSVQHIEQGSVRQFAFADSPVRLGRSPFAELQLTEEFVSRWVGTLRFDEHKVTYFNLSSTNPTFVNGREAQPNEEIAVGPDTVITVGQLSLRFSRRPVAESDLRRRGKRPPVAADAGETRKTVWLGSVQPIDRAAPAPAPSPSERPAASPSERPAAMPSSRPAASPSERPVASGSERPPASASQRPIPAGASGVVTVARTHLVTSVPEREKAAESVRPAAVTAASVAPLAAGEARGLERAYAEYRRSWEQLQRELCQNIEAAPESERASVADQLQRRFPQITQEPTFRGELKRLGLEARKPDIPEIGEWLHGIAEGVLPPGFRLDTGLTLERILGLLEILSQSIAEINDAQDSVRKRWLGRAPRSSVLQSDNGRVILAYLLNPRAEWSERALEVEESLRNVVMHEIALFKATLEGARGLLDALSPETIAQAAGVDLAQLDEEGDSPGLWQRLTSRDDSRAQLWRRFVSTYESLRDGARYQRVFMGRPFARTYLAAMGQADSGTSGADSTQPTSTTGSTARNTPTS